jgi:hypothetical protein
VNPDRAYLMASWILSRTDVAHPPLSSQPCNRDFVVCRVLYRETDLQPTIV